MFPVNKKGMVLIMKRRWLSLLGCAVVLSGVLTITGCNTQSEGGTPTSEKDDSSSSADVQEEKTENGTFILGLDDSFPPMGFRDEETKEIVGFDIDVATEVTKRLGMELTLQPIAWKQNVNELNAKNIDCIWNGYTITEARQEQVLFSDPYLRNRQVVVVRTDSGITSLDDLADKTVSVQGGSSAMVALDEKPELKESFKELLEFDENVTALMDLNQKLSDAVLVDEIVANYYIEKEIGDLMVLEETMAEEQFGIGFRLEDAELCQKVNDTLLEMAQDGTMAEISQKWFGADTTLIGK